MKQNSNKLPPEVEDKVVEVSLPHTLIAFTVLISATLTIGVAIVFTRDYTRYKRQQALIDSITKLILTLQNSGGEDSLLQNENPSPKADPEG